MDARVIGKNKRIDDMGRYQKTEKSFRKQEKQQQMPQETDDFITPLDFLDMEIDGEKEPAVETPSPAAVVLKKHKGLFVVGTDVCVGKTVAICALGTLLKQRQVDVGVMKPIDCGANDVQVFKETFDIGAVSSAGSVFSFREKITPYFAFKKNHVDFDMEKTLLVCRKVIEEHDVTFIEGPGGLFDPLTDQYSVADLVKQLGLPVVVVAPLRRGTMNHLIVLANQARACGIVIQGVLLTETEHSKPKAYFLAKMQAVRDLAKLAILGIIPFLEKGSPEEVLEKCHKKVSFKLLLNVPSEVERRPDPQQEKMPAAGEAGKIPGQKMRKSFSRGRRRRRVAKKAE